MPKLLEYESTIGDAEQWPPSRASTGNNLARPSIATVDQIDGIFDLIEHGVPHAILGYQADSVSCRISDFLQSLEHQLLRLDRSVGLRLRLGDFFRGCIPILLSGQDREEDDLSSLSEAHG